MKQDDAGLVRCGLDPERFGKVNWAGKRVFAVEDLGRGALGDMLSLRAILLPRITGRIGSQILPARAAEAFVAIMPSTLGQLSGVRADRFGETANLVRALPGFHLHAGIDPEEVSATIKTFLQTFD
jgi:hypothetical protein